MVIPVPAEPTSNWAERSKPIDHLFQDVQKHVVDEALRRRVKRTNGLHPSEMIHPEWCHRAAVFRLKLALPSNEKTYFQRENIFAEGHSIHDKWQTWLGQMGRLAGDWYCMHCEQTFWDDETPTCCPLCESTALRYGEVPLNAPPLNITSRADGYCPDDNCLIEIKSIGLGGLRLDAPELVARHEYPVGRKKLVDLDALFAEFDRPLASAYKQANLYLYLARHFEDLDVDRVVFIYDSKATSKAKSFTYRYDESVAAPFIRAAQQITDHLDAGTFPQCNVAAGGCPQCLRFDAAAEA